MAPVDPHSYTDGAHPVTAHAALAFYLDFAASAIHASALITLSASHSGDLLLDTRALAVHSASTADTPEPIPFSLAADADPVLGSALTLTLPPDTSSFLLTFSTSPDASALQWLSPPQTASNLPFVFSQCHAIHARSIFPCHDTPAARITYSLLLNVPAPLSAVAAARHVARRDPVSTDHRGACDDALWCAPGRIVEEFEMAECVPPYLFAFAAGAIGSRDVGPRTRVYAEGGDTLLDDAAREFASVEDMVKVGESLFGPYEWERFDLLVLLPSFPYGGMENPRMVFLAPTVIKGDATGAQMVAHELAHSWTGNLITNKTNEDFWLNEVTALDERYKLSESRNYEVKVAFLQLAIPTGCRCYFIEVEKCLKQVGRMKYLRPLYSSLARCSEEEKVLAKRIFSEAHELYHPIARSVVESILSKDG